VVVAAVVAKLLGAGAVQARSGGFWPATCLVAVVAAADLTGEVSLAEVAAAVVLAASAVVVAAAAAQAAAGSFN
jgi:hypothetical protein